MNQWPYPECSEDMYVSATEEFVKEMQDAMDRVKRELSRITDDVPNLLNWLKAQNSKPPTPVAKPDSDEVSEDDDDYDETLDDDYDNEYDDDDGYDDLVDEIAEELDVMGLDDDEDGSVAKKLGISKEFLKLVKRCKVVWLKKDEVIDDFEIMLKLMNLCLGPVVREPQIYCICFDYLEFITYILIDYGNRAHKAFDSYYMKLHGCAMPMPTPDIDSMKLYGRLPPFPLPDIDYMAMVKEYKLKFQQHHLSLQVLNRGPDGQQGQALQQLQKK